MRFALFFLALTTGALGQISPIRVPSDEAEQHLVGSIRPVYPPFAQETRISGIVLLEISIDATGKPQILGIISGHPLLLDEAIKAVKNSKFQPFLEAGKPTMVVTAIMVPFAATDRQIAIARGQLEFRYHFWTAENLAQAALSKGDVVEAGARLKSAEEYLEAAKDGTEHPRERLQLATDSGDLSKALQKYDEAERSYRNALETLEKGNRDAPELASIFEKLGVLYAEEKRSDLARDNLNHSVVIYQKHFRKQTSSGDAGTRQLYGQKIANQSYLLSQLELLLGSHQNAIKDCQRVIEFQSFLDAVNHERVVAACQKTINERP